MRLLFLPLVLVQDFSSRSSRYFFLRMSASFSDIANIVATGFPSICVAKAEVSQIRRLDTPFTLRNSSTQSGILQVQAGCKAETNIPRIQTSKSSSVTLSSPGSTSSKTSPWNVSETSEAFSPKKISRSSRIWLRTTFATFLKFGETLLSSL